MDRGPDGLTDPLVDEEPPQPPGASRPLSAGDSGRRRCRDVGPLLMFVLYWVGMMWIASVAWREGDLSRLEAGMDYVYLDSF